MPHNDLVLRALCDLPDPLGSLARAFPGREAATENTRWIDGWFAELAGAFLAGQPPLLGKLTTHEPAAGELSPLKRPPAASRVRLISVRPHYFRGFRALTGSVVLEADLVLIEGPNSSGKTSLAEAFEWLFTGLLSRRSSGHPRELANCIANEFRPNGEETWVECVLSINENPVTLKRVLVRDYVDTVGAAPHSDVYRDGERLTSSESQQFLESLFAGVAPILMQHTLRDFVHDTPERRRQYFERLLNIDELTALIEKAVVGDARLQDFLPPTGAVSYTKWWDLRSVIGAAGKPAVDDLERRADAASKPSLQTALAAVAISEFPKAIAKEASFSEAQQQLRAVHATEREKRFPFLRALRPPRDLLAAGKPALLAAVDSLRLARNALSDALTAAENISASDLALSRAVETLVRAGLVDASRAAAATCPVCDYSAVPTLTRARIAHVLSRLPLAAAIDAATVAYAASAGELSHEISTLLDAVGRIQLDPPLDHVFAAELQGLDSQLVFEANRVRDAAVVLVAEVRGLGALLDTAAAAIENHSRPNDDPVHAPLSDAVGALTTIDILQTDYVVQFADLERSLSVLALDDASYAFRERWLNVADDLDGVVYAIKWHHAKSKAQDLLATIRKGLIDLRSEIIEDARRSFSDSMTEVWAALRRDTASRFSRLSIPTARGRGYKLEMEVKAELSDGTTNAEVDALKVFSESQINVLGLAAYITRAKLLGHAVLIFDDPVQSMDEEHYRSLAGALLTSLLDEGFQVAVLTHSDQFTRDVADYHHARLSFATLRCRASRRHGCQVDEGSRRVSERLKRAEARAEDGELSDAWKLVRLALERLYLLAYATTNREFDTRSWRNQSAEFMWDNGAGLAIEGAVPGSGRRLGDILDMTAAGAHDKAPRGLTDLRDSVAFVRSLLTPLRIGDG